MTTQDLEAVQDGLTAIDGQLAALPADGGLAKEVGALREQLDGVRKLVASSLRQIRDA
jgi:hypothetical protein